MRNPVSVFVSVGNCSYKFSRFFESVYNFLFVLGGQYNLRVHIQSGHNDVGEVFNRHNFEFLEVKRFFSNERFDELVSTSEVFISHCGVGSVLRRMEAGKKPIILARLKSKKEHVDNHQSELKEKLISDGLAIDLEGLNPRSFLLQKVSLGNPISMIPAKLKFPSSGVVAVSSVGGHKVALDKIISHYSKAYSFYCYTDEECSDTLRSVYTRFPSCSKKIMLPVRVIQAMAVIRKHPSASVLTTGAGVGLAFTIAGRLLGRFVVAQESLTRISRPSLWFLVSNKLANVSVASPWATYKSDLCFGIGVLGDGDEK